MAAAEIKMTTKQVAKIQELWPGRNQRPLTVRQEGDGRHIVVTGDRDHPAKRIKQDGTSKNA